MTGPVSLTPIQCWYFESVPVAPERFDQSVTVELAEGVDELALRGALTAVMAHHDALRMRYEQVDGCWRQAGAGVEPVDVLSTVDGPVGFDLSREPLFRAVLFQDGSRRVLRLAAHHLVVDGVSWRILLEDLDTAYRQVVSGRPVDLGAKTTSFQQWAARLCEHAATGGFDDELGYWNMLLDNGSLPVDEDGPNTIASTRSVTVCLDEVNTRALLQDVPEVYRTQINDVLLAALARVLARWSGRDRVLVDLEGHGRDYSSRSRNNYAPSRTEDWATARCATSPTTLCPHHNHRSASTTSASSTGQPAPSSTPYPTDSTPKSTRPNNGPTSSTSWAGWKPIAWR